MLINIAADVAVPRRVEPEIRDGPPLPRGHGPIPVDESLPSDSRGANSHERAQIHDGGREYQVAPRTLTDRKRQHLTPHSSA